MCVCVCVCVRERAHHSILDVLCVTSHSKFLSLKTNPGEQDDEGVGRLGVHLSPWIHEENTFRHKRRAEYQLRADSQYLTSRKEYTDMQNSRSSPEPLEWEH